MMTGGRRHRNGLKVWFVGIFLGLFLVYNVVIRRVMVSVLLTVQEDRSPLPSQFHSDGSSSHAEDQMHQELQEQIQLQIQQRLKENASQQQQQQLLQEDEEDDFELEEEEEEEGEEGEKKAGAEDSQQSDQHQQLQIVQQQRGETEEEDIDEDGAFILPSGLAEDSQSESKSEDKSEEQSQLENEEAQDNGAFSFPNDLAEDIEDVEDVEDKSIEEEEQVVAEDAEDAEEEEEESDSGFGVSQETLTKLLESKSEGMQNAEELSSLKCKEITSKLACGDVQHCYWSADTRSCRTQLWAMKCDMTQVKKTCLKIDNCVWKSKTKTKGRYCKEEDLEQTELEPDTPETPETETIDGEEEDEENIVCKSIASIESCQSVEKCFWNKDVRACRTQPWALTCSMTQIKATCLKIPRCDWASKSKTRGKYCKDRPEDEEESEEESEEEESEEGEDRDVALEDSAVVEKSRVPQCKRLTSPSRCLEDENCYWNEGGKGSCKTHLWAMTCDMTKLKTTCLELANCTWAAPSSKRTKGRYCVPSHVDDDFLSLAKEVLNKTLDAEETQVADSVISVRIGGDELTLWKCKSLKTEARCGAFSHCAWGTSGCKFKEEYTPCDTTSLKSKCDRIPHCHWSAKSKSRGKYCFDKYFLENPHELDTKCTKIKAQDDCEAQVACEWRASSKSKGRFCERQVSLSQAQEDLRLIIPAPEIGIVSGEPKNVSHFYFQPDEASTKLLVGCPKNLECSSPEYLIDLFDTDKKTLFSKLRYNQHECCQLHGDFVKMLEVLGTHFKKNNFQNWWVDKHLLLAMAKFHGLMPPWESKASVSVVSKSSRAVRKLMENFNEGFVYRPYSIRACTESSRSPGAFSCKAMQKSSSAKGVVFYSLSHMDDEDGAELRIYPRIIPRTAKRCIFLTDGKPVPLSIVSPTGPCPYPLYDVPVRCPRHLNAYLDIKYGESWREETFVMSQTPPPDWDSREASTIDKHTVTPNSPLQDKLFWLNKFFCPTL